MKSSTGILAGSLVCLVAAGAAWWWSSVEVEPQTAPQVESTADEVSEGPAPAAELEASAGEAEVTQLDDDLDEAERSELEAAQATATGAPASNEPQAKLHGHLRDQDTGEPLPAFLLRVHDRIHKEDLLTDAEGAFASQTAFLIGRLRVDPLDQPGRRRPAPSQQIELALDEGAPAALDLAVPSGPTYRLALQPEEAPLAGLRVNLLVRGEEVQDRVGEEPVRAGENPWVRFAPIDPKFERAERLELRSGDGVWWGDAKAQGISGVQAGVVSVSLVALASLSGKVVDDSGAAVARAQVELRPVEAGSKAKRRTTSSGDDGRYRFDFVVPAGYLATFKTLRHEPREQPVALAPKATQTLDATLAAKPAVGAIRGEVVTQTGRSTPKARITLGLPRGDRSLPPLEAPVVWTTVEGRKVGRFEFTALPDGPLQLRVEHDDWFKWEPGKFDLSPPRENLRVMVYDDVATCDYVLRSRDRDNGLALERLHVWIEFEGGPAREQRVSSDEPFERGVPVERKFHWRVDRNGYGYAAGDERSFQLEEHKDGRIVRVAEVDLETGWGELLRTVRRDGKGPVAGVELLADGRSLGQTDKDGYLKVSLRDRPSAIEARHANWALQGQPDLRPAWRRDQRNYVPLTMTPIRRPRPEVKR